MVDAARRDRLKWAFSDPERLRPGETRQSRTERAAQSFATLAQSLRERGADPPVVAHFVNRLVFCMFADNVGLLPGHMFTRMLEQAQRAPAQFVVLAGDLFRVMASGRPGRRVGFETVDGFNGGLFDDDTALPPEKSDIDTVLAASNLDWSEIDPSILGPLFKRRLEPDIALLAKLANNGAAVEDSLMRTLSAKDAKYAFGRLIDLARAKPVAVAKHGRPVVVVLSVEEYERLTALDTPDTPPEREERE